MKPCADKQKLITWLALDALDAPTAQELRAHLKTCAGCRGYLAEISHVSAQLTAAKPQAELTASEAFHRKVMERLEAEAPVSMWETMVTGLRTALFNWRVSIPAMAVVAMMLTVGITQWPRTEVVVSPVAPVSVPVVAVTATAPDEAPTIANYQRVAGESPDKLDELLGRQEKQSVRATPVYTAAASSLSF